MRGGVEDRKRRRGKGIGRRKEEEKRREYNIRYIIV